MSHPLTPGEQMIVDAIKSGNPCYFLDRRSKTFLTAHAVSQMAEERGGVMILTDLGSFHVPAGTPWQEALPIPLPKEVA